MSDALIGATATLLGVILGAAIGGIGQLIAEHKQRRNVRTLLHLECERNLTALEEFWALVTNTINDQGEFERYSRLAATRPPERERLMWESLAPQLAGALRPDEIRRAYAFNARLAALGPMLALPREAFATPSGVQLWRDYTMWKDLMVHGSTDERIRANDQRREIEGRCNVFVEPLRETWNTLAKVYGDLYSGGNPISIETGTSPMSFLSA